MRSRSVHANQGFTLIELLVVMAILSILAAILFPVFQTTRLKAWQAVCVSNIQQLSRAYIMYTQDYDERLPAWIQYEPGEYMPRYKYWTEIILPYVRTKEIYWERAAQGLQIPQADGKLLSHYVLYTWGSEKIQGIGTDADPLWRWAGPPLTLAQLQNASETLNLMDGYTATRRIRGLIYRHNLNGQECMIAGFIDGHVRRLTKQMTNETITDENGLVHYRYISATIYD